MVDSFALQLLLALTKLVNQGMEEEIVKEVLAQSGGIEIWAFAGLSALAYYRGQDWIKAL